MILKMSKTGNENLKKECQNCNESETADDLQEDQFLGFND